MNVVFGLDTNHITDAKPAVTKTPQQIRRVLILKFSFLMFEVPVLRSVEDQFNKGTVIMQDTARIDAKGHTSDSPTAGPTHVSRQAWTAAQPEYSNAAARDPLINQSWPHPRRANRKVP